MKQSLAKKIIIAFLVVVSVSVAGFALLFYNTHTIVATSRVVAGEDMVRFSKVNELAICSLGQVSSIRGYLAYGTPNYLEDYERQSTNAQKLEEELAQAAKSAAGHQVLDEVKTLNNRFREIAENKLVPLKRAGKTKEADEVAQKELAPVDEALIAKVKEYQNMADKLARDELQKAIEGGETAQTVAVVVCIAVTILAIVVGLVAARIIVDPLRKVTAFVEEVAAGDLREHKQTVVSNDEIGQLFAAVVKMRDHLRELIGRMKQVSEHVVSSAQQLNASAEQSATASGQITAVIAEVARGAEDQFAAIETTVSTVEQMSAGVEEIAASAGTMAATAEKAAEAAEEGSRAVDKTVRQMASIEKAVTNSAAVVTKLGDRSKEIGMIVDTISNLAGQTNLLALNAAIEAARAGEQGRGFAVVAEEVRKLAEQSQDASKRIAELISEILGDTETAVTAMSEGTREVSLGTQVVHESGQAFQSISLLVAEVSDQVRDISAAMQQMASGSQQIVDSVRDIDTISKQTTGKSQTVSAAAQEQSATGEEIAASVAALEKMTEELEQVVGKFTL